MKQAILRLWREHPRLLAAFVLASLLAAFFAVRLVVFTLYWSDPAHRFQRVEPWMTVGYIGRSWHLDPRAIDARAGLPAPDGHPLTLAEIARARGVAVADLVAEVEAVVAQMQAEEAAAAAAAAGKAP